MERRGLTPYQRLWRLWVRIRPLGRNSALRPGASRARFYGFTRRAKQVLSLAKEEAQRQGRTDIRPEHLLLGMLRERKGMGTQALRELGVDLDTLRSRLNALAGQPLGAPEHDGEIGLSQASKRVVELAVHEGRALSHPYVGTEHILLALLAEGESAAAQALAEMGVTQERAREAVLVVLRRRPDYGVRNEWL